LPGGFWASSSSGCSSGSDARTSAGSSSGCSPTTSRAPSRADSSATPLAVAAAVLTLLLIVVPILLFVAAFLAIALGQILRFLSSETVEAALRDLPFSVAELPTDPVETVVVILQNPAVSPVLDQFGVVVGVLATTLFNVSLVLILAFFLLTEDRRLPGGSKPTSWARIH